MHLKWHQPRIFQPLTWPVIGAAVLPAAALFALAWLYGGRLISKPVTGEEIKVAVIQGNIEQERKWNPRHRDSIMRTYTDLSGSGSVERPALIVWPETATPDSITRDPRLLAQVKRLAKETGAYLVLGSSHNQKFMKNKSGQLNYLNSAFVVSPNGETPLLQQYDKIRLLPFGEYLPFKGIIPWSLIGVYELSTYTPGAKVTILEVPPFRFGVTICWENIFPDLVRQFVKNGAQFIVNITNEAWFGKTAAPYQFLSMSVFRAVENQVYVVRCANTGVSCFIDPHGRITHRVSDQSGGDIFVRGSLTSSVVPLQSRTIYTRYGDWFSPLCFLYCVVVLFCTFIRKSAARSLSEDSLHM